MEQVGVQEAGARIFPPAAKGKPFVAVRRDAEVFHENETSSGNIAPERPKKQISLADLIAGYSPEQDHPLYETAGEPKGKEIW